MSAGQPLLGDGNGRYKVQMIGNSGAGKSTVGTALAGMLGVPYVSLDSMFWTPGWGRTPPAEFEAKVCNFMAQNAETGWVIDGTYDNVLGKIMAKETTDIIWLDPPLLLTFYRVFIRTLLRLLGLRPPCSPECFEELSETLSRKSILVWCLKNHTEMRRKGWVKMNEMAIGSGTNEGSRKMRRLGGWGSQCQEWLASVAKICLGKKTV